MSRTKRCILMLAPMEERWTWWSFARGSLTWCYEQSKSGVVCRSTLTWGVGFGVSYSIWVSHGHDNVCQLVWFASSVTRRQGWRKTMYQQIRWDLEFNPFPLFWTWMVAHHIAAHWLQLRDLKLLRSSFEHIAGFCGQCAKSWVCVVVA
jgi:hypothetical protein